MPSLETVSPAARSVLRVVSQRQRFSATAQVGAGWMAPDGLIIERCDFLAGGG
jgi:hypothetical protein